MNSNDLRSPRYVSIAIPQLTGGGAEKLTTNVAKLLARDGLLSRVYTGSSAGGERLEGINIVNLAAPRAISAVRKLPRRLKGDEAEAFLLTLGYVNLAPMLRLARPRARIVLRIGNTVTSELRTLSRVARLRYLYSIRLAARSADAIIVQCHHMGEDLDRHLGGARRKLRVVYNFVEDELWRWTAPEAPPLADPYIFCAASMKPQKGFDLLLAGYAQSGRRATARLVVAGVDHSNNQFARLMQKNGLAEGEVIRLGFLPKPYGWMAHAELCVLTSRFEGFSNFLLEAAALGKRIVATDCPGGNSELFAHYPNAQTVPVDDIAALARALGSSRHDLDRLKARKYLQSFEQDHIYARYVDILTGSGTAGAHGTSGAS